MYILLLCGNKATSSHSQFIPENASMCCSGLREKLFAYMCPLWCVQAANCLPYCPSSRSTSVPVPPPPLASPFTTNLPMGLLAFMPTDSSKPLGFCTSAWFFLHLLLEIRENTSFEAERNFLTFVDIQHDVHCSTDEWKHKNYSDLQCCSG